MTLADGRTQKAWSRRSMPVSGPALKGPLSSGPQRFENVFELIQITAFGMVSPNHFLVRLGNRLAGKDRLPQLLGEHVTLIFGR